MSKIIEDHVIEVKTEISLRNQQYKDKLADNMDYYNILKARLRSAQELQDKIKEKITDLKEYENVARINHPRHEQLT